MKQRCSVALHCTRNIETQTFPIAYSVTRECVNKLHISVVIVEVIAMVMSFRGKATRGAQVMWAPPGGIMMGLTGKMQEMASQ